MNNVYKHLHFWKYIERIGIFRSYVVLSDGIADEAKL